MPYTPAVPTHLITDTVFSGTPMCSDTINLYFTYNSLPVGPNRPGRVRTLIVDEPYNEANTITTSSDELQISAIMELTM